jgi:hypothetical protein
MSEKRCRMRDEESIRKAEGGSKPETGNQKPEWQSFFWVVVSDFWLTRVF